MLDAFSSSSRHDCRACTVRCIPRARSQHTALCQPLCRPPQSESTPLSRREDPEWPRPRIVFPRHLLTWPRDVHPISFQDLPPLTPQLGGATSCHPHLRLHLPFASSRWHNACAVERVCPPLFQLATSERLLTRARRFGQAEECSFRGCNRL
ncbi:hypothetical protein K470DRAFT_59312 [Piedraia hortae CBS 480.64]|uniref:Uncharacterized protein n=1 Tax=Piedraia hortae CBS 480.64 TaxID=1314780 RepID=A0A6A7C025_9PEZI|nr:hypothetical protein K470DRAFT_59312 [Piedraia hortae CBS 480.64]